ncbi:MauE/DoxX family redox-associated membrane protein [Actinokineospora sp. 24-640]
MAYLVFAARCLLVLVFAASAVGKLRGRAAFAAFVQATAALAPLAGRYSAPLAGAVVAAEVGIVVLLAVPATAAVGLAAALVLLSAFTAAIALALRRGSSAPCRCFGGSGGDRPVGTSDLARNAVLALAAVTGLAGPVGAGDPLGLAMAGVTALVLAALVLNFDSLTYLVAGLPRSDQKKENRT